MKKKVVFSIIFILILIVLGTVKSNAGSLYLKELDFKAQIKNDGSMDVTETWNINIGNTNTLYKSFKTDKNKYSSITNVTVKEITNDQEIEFSKSDEWAYHVQKGYYYGTKNKDGDFEIGWGVGLDNSRAYKKYQIAYTVKDVITKYNDYAELYWQFVGKDFEINAKEITGTIYLPSNVSNKEEIRVWGHTAGLNGTIYATDTNRIEFQINNFINGKYVEVRTLFPTNLIGNSRKIKNTDILDKAIKEETKWANKANATRDAQKVMNEIFPILLKLLIFTINIILIIVYFRKTIKYKKYLKTLSKFKPTTELKYYRDLPDENSTPGEAIKTLKLNKITETNFGKVFSATILDLTLKKYLDIRQEKNNKEKDIIKIYILKQDSNNLKPSEEMILSFVVDATKGENSITLKDLEKYIKNNSNKIQNLINMADGIINSELINDEIVDKEMYEKYDKTRAKQIGYITTILVGCFMPVIIVHFIIPIIIFLINAIMCGKIAKRLNILTQKGVDLQEQWKGLKKYMEDFSMLDKREVPELIVWEKYLVYATAFGIADKVIKQLKIVYPNFDEITTMNMATYTYMNVMINTDFNKSFSSAISSSISSTYSSGSGGGGGFSGGGGFGRRPEAAVDGR